MTTTGIEMSNPTELPDLDAERLLFEADTAETFAAATFGRFPVSGNYNVTWVQDQWNGWQRAIRARRAQPEGEAPAPASIVITLRQAHRLVEFFGGHDASITVTPPRAEWGDMPCGLYAFCTEYPEDGSEYLGVTEVDDELTRLDERGSAARAALAAKAEAPTHCDPAEGFCVACREQERTHLAAQQAAAPGSRDGTETQEPAGWLFGNSFFERGNPRTTYQVRTHGRALYERHAPSAPGTPEAPKQPAHGHRDDYYLLANGRRLGLEPISRVRNMPNWVLAMELFATGSTSAHQICRDAGIDPDGTTIQRAAQLDGGQGEGKAHG